MDQRQLQGRPRDPRVDKAIRDTARHLLLDEGYAAVTVERVAKEAQVSKTTIYRRWPSKADLVFDLVFGAHRQPGDVIASTSDPLGDLTTTVQVLAREFTTPEAQASLLGLLGDFAKDPQLQLRTDRRLVDPDYELVSKILERARSKGLLEDDIDDTLAKDMLFGTVFVWGVILGRPLDDHAVVQMIDLLLRGIGKKRRERT